MSPDDLFQLLQKDPTSCVEKLDVASKHLRELSEAQKDTWIQAFSTNNGFSRLFDIVSRITLARWKGTIQNAQKTEQILLSAVSFVKECMSSDQGLQVMAQEKYLKTIAFQYDTTNVEQRALVLQLLTAICLVPNNGRENVLAALTALSKIKHYTGRFYALVKSLREDRNLDVKLAVMMLINTIITTTADLNARIELRDEFTALGVTMIIKDLSGTLGSEELEEQFSIWSKELAEDTIRIEQLASQAMEGVDFRDLGSVFSKLEQNCSAKEQLLTLLQRLLVLPSDEKTQIRYLEFINRLVEKVIAQTSEEDLKDLFISQEDLAALRASYDEQIATLEARLTALQEGKTEPEKKNSSPTPPPSASPSAPPEEDFLNLTSSLAGEPTIEGGSAPPGGPPAPPPPPPPGAGPPPPPPPPGGSGPMPPPPPPGGPGGPPPPPPMGGGGLPPPPPGGFGGPPPPGGPKKRVPKLPKPKQNMKKFNWTKIPDMKIDKTIWSCDASEIEKIELDLDIKAIEELFRTPDPKKESAAGDAAKDSKPKVVSLLDMKRTNAVGIMLANIKKTSSEINKEIQEGNETAFTIENLLALKGSLPTAEEEEMLTGYQGDPKSLARAEQFLLDLIKIPRLAQRIEILIYLHTLPSSMAELRKTINTVLQAISEVENSAEFSKLLKVVLSVGNFLNSGTAKGAAGGFKLEALLKLADTKSTDNKTNLLRFIAAYISKQYPELLHFMKTLSHVEDASRITLESVREDMNNMRKAFKIIEEECSAAFKDQELQAYQNKLNRFTSSIRTQSASLLKLQDEVVDKYKAVTEKYGEDPESCKIEQFFTIIANFGSSFEQCIKENEREKVKAEKERQKLDRLREKEEARAREKEKKKESESSGSKPSSSGGGGGGGGGSSSSSSSSSKDRKDRTKMGGSAAPPPDKKDEGSFNSMLDKLRDRSNKAANERDKAKAKVQNSDSNEVISMLSKVRKQAEQ